MKKKFLKKLNEGELKLEVVVTNRSGEIVNARNLKLECTLEDYIDNDYVGHVDHIFHEAVTGPLEELLNEELHGRTSNEETLVGIDIPDLR